MKSSLLRKAVIGALCTASVQAFATGFITLPQNGSTTTSNTGTVGITAYIRCNTTGDFGSNPNGSTFPSATANNDCAIFAQNRYDPLNGLNPNPPPSPLTGYTRKAQTYRDIVMTDPAYVNTTPVTVGRLRDEVWRNAANTSCIYAAKFALYLVDYDLNTPGVQTFEVNDLARAGFRNRAPVSVAYDAVTRGPGASDEVLFRAGLTATSVPHPIGADDLPLTSVAPISNNWVDFTTDVNALDPDGSSPKDSSWFYVRSSCNAAAPQSLASALKLVETGQEGQPPIVVTLPAYVPAGATTAQ